MASEINMTEIYFEWWLDELKSLGLVHSYQREPHTFVLKDAEPIFYNQHYKSKNPLVKNFNLFRPITYTPDYKVYFNGLLLSKLIGIISKDKKLLYDLDYNSPGSVYQETLFYTIANAFDYVDCDLSKKNIEVWFDVKPPSKALQFSGALGSSREFPYNQRLMYEEHNIIVNKVVPIGNSNCLFSKTFLPHRYRFTDKSGAMRKLKPYEEKSNNIQGYLSLKNIQL